MISKKIGMKSYAEFVSGTESARARILRGYKYPNDESMAMATYYGPAKAIISEFHNEKHKPEWLWTKVYELEQKAMTPSKSLRTKLLNNSRSIRDYANSFSNVHYDSTDSIRLSFTMHGVTINVTPDLHAILNGSDIYVKFNFSKEKLKYEYIRAIRACMSYALFVNMKINDPNSVMFVDVPRGVTHNGISITSDIVDEIGCNCIELESVWNLL